MVRPRHRLNFSVAIRGLLAFLAWPLTSLAQVQKCVDPTTGAITFSDRGCRVGETTSAVRVRPANSTEAAPYRQQASTLSKLHDSPEPERKGAPLTVVGENDDDRQRRKLCKEASTPYKGAHGLTASQRVAASQLCAGITLPAPVANTAPRLASMPAPAPAVMASCDAGGCWATKTNDTIEVLGRLTFPPPAAPPANSSTAT